jgi:hypothetical protein
MYRSHSTRYAAAAARIRRQLAESPPDSEESIKKLLSKSLFQSKTPGLYLSFSNFSQTETPEEVNSSLSIQQDSVNLSSKLSFKFSNKAAASVTVFFFAKELLDGQTKSMFFSLTDKSPNPVMKKFNEPGERLVEFELEKSFDLNKFADNDWNFEDRSTFPMIIWAKSLNENLILYFKGRGKVEKIRENYSNSSGSYEIRQIERFCNDVCVVCDEEEPADVFVPCGHSCACKKCVEIIAKQGRRCPMCRSYIFGWCNKFG